MSFYDIDDRWGQESWTCQDCGAPLPEAKYGPGARWCWTCRKPGEVAPPEPKICDGCDQAAERLVLFVRDRLCPKCLEPALAAYEKAALAKAEREGLTVRKPIHVLAAQPRMQEE